MKKIQETDMASVAKGLRHRFVVPTLAGSNPVVRPYLYYIYIYSHSKPLSVDFKLHFAPG